MNLFVVLYSFTYTGIYYEEYFKLNCIVNYDANTGSLQSAGTYHDASDNTATLNNSKVLVPGELSGEEAEGILYMRLEEKLARDVYTVLGNTWNARIFENIKLAEQNHMDAVKRLISKV